MWQEIRAITQCTCQQVFALCRAHAIGLGQSVQRKRTCQMLSWRVSIILMHQSSWVTCAGLETMAYSLETSSQTSTKAVIQGSTKAKSSQVYTQRQACIFIMINQSENNRVSDIDEIIIRFRFLVGLLSTTSSYRRLLLSCFKIMSYLYPYLICPNHALHPFLWLNGTLLCLSLP